MGVDFYNVQVFAGDRDPEQVRRHALDSLGYRKDLEIALDLDVYGFDDARDEDPDFHCAFAVGPAGRWIAVYDSWLGWDDCRLATRLSHIAPTVRIQMNDSAAVHFHLFRAGERTDSFGNAPSIILRWGSEDQREHYAGKPYLWDDLLIDPTNVSRLRESWQEFGDADRIMQETGRLLGWHPILCGTGYTLDYDGVPEYYRAYIQGVHETERRVTDMIATGELAPRDPDDSWPGDPVDLASFTEFTAQFAI